MKLKVLLTIILSLMLLGIVQAEEPVKCPGKVSVLSAQVFPGTFQEYALLEVAVLPGQSKNLISPIPAAVKTIEKAAGSEVKAGDVIVMMDNEALKKEVEEAQANLKKWQKIYFQRSHWKVRSPGAEKAAQDNVKKYEELLAAKQEQLNKCSVTAPIDGIVSVLKVKEGDHISEGFHIGSVIDMSSVVVPVEQHADKLEAGQAVNVAVKELNKKFEASVKKGEGTFLVIGNGGNEIQMGMNAAFKVLVNTHHNALILPKDKIFTADGGSYVYVADGKYAKKVAVKVGPETNGNVLIQEGLTAGNEVIVAEVLSAKEGTLKDEITCLQDGKKIVIVVKDEAEGKYVKRKKGAEKLPVSEVDTKPVKKEQPKVEKKKEVVKPKKVKKQKPAPSEVKQPKFRIGLFGSYAKMSNSDFDDIYGEMTTFGADVSYFITDKIDVWLTVQTGSKTATNEFFPDEELEFKFLPVTLDVRYYFKRGNKFDIYAGAGLSYVDFEDKNPILDISDNAVGFNLVGGTYYKVTKNIALQLALRWNYIKKSIDAEIETDNDLDLSNLELLFGLSIGF